MKAWQIEHVGMAMEKGMRLKEVNPPPAPKSGEVLVQISAVGLNPADWKIPEYHSVISRLKAGVPFVPGLDFCGRVLQLPPDALPELQLGQLVFGRMDFPSKHGVLADRALVPVSGTVPLPAGISVAEAAGVGVGAMTAWWSLAEYVRPGSRVFVNGGSGGSGIFCIQMAKALGCHVVASCSGGNAALCTELGADEIIDYTQVDIVEALVALGEPMDVVVDLVGNRLSLHQESMRFLAPDGTFVLVAHYDGTWAKVTSMLRSAFLPRWLGGTPRAWKVILPGSNREALKKTAEWMEQGKIRTVIDSTFEFEDAKQAVLKLKTNRARGKIVIKNEAGDA